MASFEADINQRIWQVVAAIPRGRVSTYGEIARRAGMPGAARRAGAALKALHGQTRIPWHRVLNASGRISLPPGSSAALTQRQRLEDEGVAFKPNGSVDMKQFAWDSEV